MVLENALRLGVITKPDYDDNRAQFTTRLERFITRKDILSDYERTELKRLHYRTKEKELIQEVTNVAPLRHPNLIRLLGIVGTSENQNTDGEVRVVKIKKWFKIRTFC